MVHADATHFELGVSKREAYEQVTDHLQGLMDGQRNWVACQTISFSRGVCGKAASMKKTQIVEDVHAFAGHIACDSSTRSEIVVPIILDSGEVVGVIDIDCEEQKGFTDEDRVSLEKIATMLAKGCDWGFLQ
ncbi:gaf protein [Drechslerella dactyloides]|uniref:Gaf protein n=1 Tax=Drechslerella dactyloides TaxID=74499 RepID=A0AAD6ISQ4_DREDA|nr:gaf protein [Drechslerella dactyloides]